MTLDRPNITPGINRAALIAILAYCVFAIFMEFVRGMQHAPGGAPYGFESLEERIALSAPLGPQETKGKILYDHYCAVCHGDSGQADGLNASRLTIGPRDFTAPEFRARLKDETAVVKVIREGGLASGLSSSMPPWGLTLNPTQTTELVTYLKKLAGPPAGAPGP